MTKNFRPGILFAFDPRRNAILLVGGDKTGDKRWYKTNLPIADARFDKHLAELKEEEEKAKSLKRKDGNEKKDSN